MSLGIDFLLGTWYLKTAMSSTLSLSLEETVA